MDLDSQSLRKSLTVKTFDRKYAVLKAKKKKILSFFFTCLYK